MTDFVLESARLRLRVPEARDRHDWLAVFGDPRVMRYWSTPPLADLAAADQRIATAREFQGSTHRTFAIVKREDGRVIGTTTLFAIRADQGRAEVGYALGAEHWGCGYAREAVARLVDHAFDDLKLRRLESDIDPRNARSVHLVESLGFRQEGLFRQRWFVNDELQDSVMHGLLARDWRARRATRAT